eukprot:4901831-Alexandrium_andersonii.AAC.1
MQRTVAGWDEDLCQKLPVDMRERVPVGAAPAAPVVPAATSTADAVLWPVLIKHDVRGAPTAAQAVAKSGSEVERVMDG